MATSIDTVIKSLDELDISYPNIVLSYDDKQYNTKPSKIISPILMIWTKILCNTLSLTLKNNVYAKLKWIHQRIQRTGRNA